MAVDPSQEPKAGKRFFTNETPPLLQVKSPKACLIQSASRIVRDCPPTLPWASLFRGEVYRGLFIGPTSIAYFFLALSAKHPDLEIEGKRPADWCSAYLELGQDLVPPALDVSCGMSNEYLASNALKACLYQDERYARKVLAALQTLDTDPTYCEWLKGRAGALCILRVLRKWLPSLATALNLAITSLIEAMIPQQPWVWSGGQYLGTVHGEIGILTQIVLSDASYAPELESKLLELLKLQGEEGNWPIIEGKEIGLIQFCHGAPGFVLSLLAIRSYFPTLHADIDAAVALARNLIWEKGLLTKEPNICHGILGNGLALDARQREHFFCLATPDRIQSGLADGAFEKDLDPFGLLWGEAGRAWAWMEVWDGSEGKCCLYTDV
ncbi:LanC-like protein-like protein [Lachnellula occidentalis]|uniref:LanC-like protein-like protein n=1 Tax=Lachnellula occidentalis TaxID=215460 RepID=A0A8H8RP92_9HELO|nr:LanC-like protein-like protein [Lachnellula occidentalis]